MNNEVLQHRGISTLVYNQSSFLPELTAQDQRIKAAVVYVSHRRSGDSREVSRAAAIAAASLPDSQVESIRQKIAASEQSERETARLAAESRASAARIEREQQIALAVLPVEEVFRRALKHVEKCRWEGKGWQRHGHWTLARHELNPFSNPTESEANNDSYQNLVTLLGRRATNTGGGNRIDVTSETPNDPAKVRFARSIALRKKVSPKKLLAIADAHTRAWAIEQCGGWARMIRHLGVVEKTKAGTLLDGQRVGMDRDLLVVKCPSTGQQYVLWVPRSNRLNGVRTVARALKSVNDIDGEKLAAQS